MPGLSRRRIPFAPLAPPPSRRRTFAVAFPPPPARRRTSAATLQANETARTDGGPDRIVRAGRGRAAGGAGGVLHLSRRIVLFRALLFRSQLLPRRTHPAAFSCRQMNEKKGLLTVRAGAGLQ